MISDQTTDRLIEKIMVRLNDDEIIISCSSTLPQHVQLNHKQHHHRPLFDLTVTQF